MGIAVLISGFVSLSHDAHAVQPDAACRRIEHGACSTLFETHFDRARDFYGSTLRWTTGAPWLVLVGSALVLVLTGVHLRRSVPQGFIPRQDTGGDIGNTRAPEGITFDELERHATGWWRRNRARIPTSSLMSAPAAGHRRRVRRQYRAPVSFGLKPREERKEMPTRSCNDLRRRGRADAQDIAGVFTATRQRSTSAGSIGSNAHYQYVLQGTGSEAALHGGTRDLEDKLRESSYLRDVSSDLQLRQSRKSSSIFCATARPRWACRANRSRPRFTTRTAGGRSARIYGATDQYLGDDSSSIAAFQTDINALDSLFMYAVAATAAWCRSRPWRTSTSAWARCRSATTGNCRR